MAQLWPNTVVEENNLTVIISMLRKALGDDLEQKKYILTNPGRGYRFVAVVSEVGSDDPAVPASISTPAAVAVGAAPAALARSATEGRGAPRRILRRFLPRRISPAQAVVAVGLVALLALLGAREWSKRSVTQTIAVLPFRSVGVERDGGYLGLGMADGLVARLRSIRHVVVRPTADVIKYQQAYDPQALAKDLQVSSLLDGAVQASGDQVSLWVKLTRAKDGAILWSQEYQGSSADILILQDRIAEQTARALALKLDSGEQEGIHRHHTSNTDAYLKYMGGRYYCGERATRRSLRQGVALFEQATTMDSQFALAQ